MSCMTMGGKKLRELQIKLSEGIKWIYIYPTTSQTISGSSPMRHWRCLIYKNPQLSHGHPWCPGCLTNTISSMVLHYSRATQVAQWERICLQCRIHRRRRFDSLVRKIPWRRAWQPTPLFLPGESLGQRILAGCSPWGYSLWDPKELDTTE